jgi:LPS O-antigen subunit length determinant protein (WzzB/FepE family)
MSTYIQSFSDFIILIYSKRKAILIFTLLIFIISTGVSFLIKEKFQSSATIYPYNFQAFDPKTMYENKKTFGSKEDLERIQQIGSGNSILQYLKKRFDLNTEYNIDKQDPFAYDKLKKAFFANFEVLKNSTGGLDITYIHSNPDTAAALVNYAVYFIDSVNQATFMYNYKVLYDHLLITISEKEKTLDSLSANNSSDPIIRNQIAIKQLENIELKSRLQSALKIIQNPPTSISIIEQAIPNYKKVYPKKLLVIGFSTVAALLSYMLYLYLQVWYTTEIAPRLDENK